MGKKQECVLRGNLDEVSFIRPILILQLVLYHSMCIHTGNWETPDGVTQITIYKIVGRLVYSFMLVTFVFISGYVWAYQRETLGKEESFLTVCRKKIIRLIVPTIIFGLLYIFLIEDSNFNFLHLLSGPGHLWFLPMLFWCFLFGWLILKLNWSPKIILPLLFLVCLVKPAFLPLGLSHSLYYLPFFFLGYYIYRKYYHLKDGIKLWHILLCWLTFIVAWVAVSWLRSMIIEKTPSYKNIAVLLNLIYEIIGTLSFFITAVYVTKRYELKSWYINIGGLCMGIYIFQQFILKVLYYKTGLPLLINGYLLPWIGFLVTLVVSIISTLCIRKTKIGRKIF